MVYEIVLSPEAIDDLRDLKASLRATIKKDIELYLRHNPTQLSKSRIKRLRGLSRPQYRLRVEDIRVFYDVSGNQVEILAIVSKSDAEHWLEGIGEEKKE